MTTSYDVAGMFLRAINAPDTQNMRRAVAIWLRFESGGTVVGNNPWNLHSGDACTAAQGYCPGQGSLPGQIGNRYAGPGDRNVAVFSTLDAGVRASAQNIMRQGYGYPAVVKAARADDPVAFLTALQESSWSAGHYGHSKLVSAFRSSLSYNLTMTIRSVTGNQQQHGDNPTPSEFQALLDKLGINSDTNHVITHDEAVKIARQYGVQEGSDVFNRIVQQFEGKSVLDASGGGTVPDVRDDVGGIVKGIGDVFGFLFDAENWLYILALLAGVALTGIGGKLIIDATSTPIGEGTGVAS